MPIPYPTQPSIPPDLAARLKIEMERQQQRPQMSPEQFGSLAQLLRGNSPHGGATQMPYHPGGNDTQLIPSDENSVYGQPQQQAPEQPFFRQSEPGPAPWLADALSLDRNPAEFLRKGPTR